MSDTKQTADPVAETAPKQKYFPSNRGSGEPPAKTREQQAATDLLARARQRADERKKARQQEVDKGRQWFVTCARCGLPGIMLARHPKLDPYFKYDEWWSRDKPRETPYLANTFPCQNCRTPVRVVAAPELGEFHFDDASMRHVDSMESYDERTEKAEKERDEILLAKSVPTVQISRGGKS